MNLPLFPRESRASNLIQIVVADNRSFVTVLRTPVMKNGRCNVVRVHRLMRCDRAYRWCRSGKNIRSQRRNAHRGVL